jgi:hypothetical protein
MLVMLLRDGLLRKVILFNPEICSQILHSYLSEKGRDGQCFVPKIVMGVGIFYLEKYEG